MGKIKRWKKKHQKGEELPNKLENEGIEWLTDKYPKFVVFLLQFQMKDKEIFPSMMFTDSVLNLIAQKWWTVMEKKASDPDFKNMCRFLAKLHSISASSASNDRLAKS